MYPTIGYINVTLQKSVCIHSGSVFVIQLFEKKTSAKTSAIFIKNADADCSKSADASAFADADTSVEPYMHT